MSSSAVVPLIPRAPGFSLPPELRCGDDLTFEVQTGLPAGWHIFFVLTAVVNNVPKRILLGRDDAGTYLNPTDANGLALFNIPATVTAVWPAGRFDWALFSLSPDGLRAQIAQGGIILQPDIAGAAVVDGRTHAEKMLDAIRTVLLGNALDDAMSYKIGTRELVKIPRKDLMREEAIYEARVRRERGLKPRRRGPAIIFGGR